MAVLPDFSVMEHDYYCCEDYVNVNVLCIMFLSVKSVATVHPPEDRYGTRQKVVTMSFHYYSGKV